MVQSVFDPQFGWVFLSYLVYTLRLFSLTLLVNDVYVIHSVVIDV